MKQSQRLLCTHTSVATCHSEKILKENHKTMNNILQHLTLTPVFVEMIGHFILCMCTIFIIVDKLYFKKSKRRDFYFTFILIAVAIFFLVFFMIFMLEDLKAKTSIGIGIGLFGIFSIMRYRTDAMPVREMTYLFSIIALAVVNAIAGPSTLLELLLTDIIFVAAIWLCEKQLKQLPSKLVQYDRIELITPEKKGELKADLKQRLGLDIVHIEIGGVDFLKDMAVLKVYYNAEKLDNSMEHKTKMNTEDFKTFQ